MWPGRIYFPTRYLGQFEQVGGQENNFCPECIFLVYLLVWNYIYKSPQDPSFGSQTVVIYVGEGLSKTSGCPRTIAISWRMVLGKPTRCFPPYIVHFQDTATGSPGPMSSTNHHFYETGGTQDSELEALVDQDSTITGLTGHQKITLKSNL